MFLQTNNLIQKIPISVSCVLKNLNEEDFGPFMGALTGMLCGRIWHNVIIMLKHNSRCSHHR